MRQSILFITFLLSLFPLGLSAERWSAETLPMVHLSDARRYVCNPDGILSPAAVDSIDCMLLKLEKDKGVESVVIVCEHVEGSDPYSFGMSVGRKYGVGSKAQRTGLIVVLATKDRKYHILTGNGLEGTLPDGICKRIENRFLVPHLKKAEWDAGMIATISALDHTIRGDRSLYGEKVKEVEDDMLASFLGFCLAMIIAGGALIFAAIASRRSKCPRCGQADMRVVHKQRVRMHGSWRWYIRSTYRCPRCGYEKVTFDEESDNIDTAIGAGIIAGSLFGGHGQHGGGGNIGGSFGGGSFGGGGAGGSF